MTEVPVIRKFLCKNCNEVIETRHCRKCGNYIHKQKIDKIKPMNESDEKATKKQIKYIKDMLVRQNLTELQILRLVDSQPKYVSKLTKQEAMKVIDLLKGK